MRNLHFDILRLIAFSMVILMHSPLPNGSSNGLILSGLSYITSPCIGIFFMLSGALILKKIDVPSFSIRVYLGKRLSKILYPLLFWSIVGHILEICGFENAENGVLWFLYAMIGLYLLTPVLLRWLSAATKGEVEFYLLLWGITLCYPYLKDFFFLNEGDKSWVYYFHGYVGYFVLGSYLKTYELSRSRIIGIVLLFLLFSIVLPLCVIVFKWNVDFYSWFWYLSLSVVLQTIVWWLVLQKYAYLFETLRPLVTELSKLSFGIYLVHILVMRNFLWKLEWMQSLSGLIQIIVCAALTFSISAALCFFLSKWKHSKYIIGV